MACFVTGIPGEPWRGRIIGGLAVLAVGVLHRLGGETFAPLFYPAVALAALLTGWPGGVAAALLSAIALLSLSREPSQSVHYPTVLTLFGLGLLIGLVTRRLRWQRDHFQKLTEQLSGVYEKVQANFEGMKRAERLSALGQLSAGLAHEIRNPLASISGAASILRRNPDLDPKQAKCVEVIAAECQRLNGLLTNFLNFARPRPPRLQIVELDPVLESVLALAGHGIRGKTVYFEKRVEPHLPSVECDPEQLEQVLLNLMINAIEASPDGETVTLIAAPEDRHIAIRVIDRGHGVAPAHIDRLFDPFFTTKEHGTGLGLPVAHQIMRQMGGSLLAQGNADRGMTFSVNLPAKNAET